VAALQITLEIGGRRFSRTFEIERRDEAAVAIH
jgi:hypothetical protein